MNNNNNNLILIVFTFVLIYCIYEINNLKNKENFSTSTTAEIERAVKKIYLADVEAIRILSNFAIQLSQGGTTIPGNLNFDGNITLTGTGVNSDNKSRINFSKYTILESADRTHIYNPNEQLVILNKTGTVISTGWGGCGDLKVDNQLSTKILRIEDNTGHPITISSPNNENTWMINNYPKSTAADDRLIFRAWLKNRNGVAGDDGWSGELFSFYKDGTFKCKNVQTY